mmetsp:Transcript_9987/g.16793  ORF Transcript_9987/g.16793 Transcript_9987/m.16793 type:complete len:91 (-) Transcript_9987:541-813(-)
MRVDWKLEVKSSDSAATLPHSEMNSILAYVQPINTANIYACGEAYEDVSEEPSFSKASFMKLDEDGDILFLYKWGDSGNFDSCKGIDYNT